MALEAVSVLETRFPDLRLTIAGDGPAREMPAFDGTPQPYTVPVLNSYKDMSELLALDPPMPGLEQVPWKDSDAA